MTNFDSERNINFIVPNTIASANAALCPANKKTVLPAALSLWLCWQESVSNRYKKYSLTG